MSGLEVCAAQCGQCLFSANRIVSKASAAGHIRSALARDSWFTCHKGTLAGRDIVCRGFYDRYKRDTRALRMAIAFGIVRFVEPPTSTKGAAL